ncbi:DNA/RNA non-specific endonuclease [Mesorhizobium xinjiangense]|uniref:DNA/RNA non-specific endonuclease n=1 Tax=Mesorhizobium xinjiangense TaxID=2678685 RepID=UPI0018DD70DB|nr:DNA/RNA non-specific endonuclease [Mesorhizobium xinjiangense]
MNTVMQSRLQDLEVLEELRQGGLLLEIAAHAQAESPYAMTAAAAGGQPIDEAVERIRSGRADIFHPDLAEAIIFREGYPSLLVRNGDYEEPKLATWRRRIDPHRAAIRGAIANVGRIELTGHPQFNWIGTGWVLDEDVVVTNRHVARIFADPASDFARFRPGVAADIDFFEEHENTRELVAAISEIIHVEAPGGADMALLRLDPRKAAALGLTPIPLSERPPQTGYIGVIGYPARDPRNDAGDMSRIFDDIYDKKRFAPGSVMDTAATPLTFTHNCTTLGGNSGSAVIDVASGHAVGLHFGGLQGDRNHAVNARTIRDIAARHSVPVARPSDVPPVPADDTETTETLAGRAGYDAGFLGEGVSNHVPLPHLNPLQMRQAARLADGGTELRYTHFSLAMNAARRLAFFTAVNIDGTQLWHNPRRRDHWKTDPRIPEDAQVDNALYRHNDFDRGHLVRRLDPVWGTREEAAQAEADTFHYTNAAPQHRNLNQRIWLDLENHVLTKTEERDARISVFAGPVFGSADPRSKRSGLEEVGIPLGFWKVIASVGRTRRDRRTLQAQAFVLWQWDMFGEPDLEAIFGQGFETYQLGVADLERLTGLDFSPAVRAADTFGEAEIGEAFAETMGALPAMRRELIRSSDDIV